MVDKRFNNNFDEFLFCCPKEFNICSGAFPHEWSGNVSFRSIFTGIDQVIVTMISFGLEVLLIFNKTSICKYNLQILVTPMSNHPLPDCTQEALLKLYSLE